MPEYLVIALVVIVAAAVIFFFMTNVRGRKNGHEEPAGVPGSYAQEAEGILRAVGGKENVMNVDYCATRLRFELKNYSQVDEKAVKAAGATGIIRPGKNVCQVIVGIKVKEVYSELKKLL